MTDVQTYTSGCFYDLMPGFAAPMQPDVNLYLHYALKAQDALEIGAGTGRVALPIARAGIPVWCVEPSDSMRNAMLVKLAQEPAIHPMVTVAPGDHTDFGTDRRFGLVYARGLHPHILTDDDHRALLAQVKDHLLPKGLYIFDMVNVDKKTWRGHAMETIMDQKIGVMSFRIRLGTEMTGEDTCTYTTHYETVLPDGSETRMEEVTQGRFMTLDQMYALLDAAGFEVVETFSNFDFAPYAPECDQAVIVARLKQ